jgi:VanZ family protein
LIPRRWWPPVAWLGAILTATSLPNTVIPDVRVRFADKGVHFFMYGGLGLLLARAMHNPPRTTRPRVVLAAILLVVTIGFLDEWHQRFIQGRSAELADGLADSAGGLVGALIWVAANRAKSPRTA